MHPKILPLACAGAALVCALGLSRLDVRAQSGTDYGNAPPPPPPPQGDALLVHDAGVAVSAKPTTATISLVTTPSVAANVYWGRKLLGKHVPGKGLVIVRPYDSGPLDLMVRAQGYLPVQTRAHTFSDSRLLVKLTELGKESELLGYRAPLDAGSEGGVPGEAGVPSEAGVAREAGVDASVWIDASYFPPVAPAPSPLL